MASREGDADALCGCLPPNPSIKVLSDMRDELEGFVTVHDVEHQVAFAAR